MKELFVPLYIACYLEFVGFKEPCIQRYTMYLEDINLSTNGRLVSNKGKWEVFNDYDDTVGAPLYDQVIGWLRKEHNKSIEIINFVGTINNGWSAFIYEINSKKPEIMEIEAISYEEIRDKAILEALKLI